MSENLDPLPITCHYPLMPFHKTSNEIIALLTVLNARSAARGKPCPVAASVVERLEAQGSK